MPVCAPGAPPLVMEIRNQGMDAPVQVQNKFGVAGEYVGE
jgi:hypothetical protein